MTQQPLDSSVREFGQALRQLVRRIRAAGASHELSWTQVVVIGRLFKEGPATIADLARDEGMKPQSMRTLIAGLESMGFVERQPHPTDGRSVHIALTPKGVAIRTSARDARRTWLAHAIAQLDAEEQDTLFAATEIIKRLSTL
ncbi:MarR family winged helix-turn-helix transcriptional regulator [Oceanidesulfovibrio marinus]|uniref:MarR family transcriptional regulator n=1 Tax=Oceanidesulfovibrio marinus TaxID=370038 RepID=A0A6P1ZAS8_9BACT|nr:MarR family transcriptional regulator [Oceanidesulfovibrio marinus]TVM30811.1 MarR family transcriptional regulator [Oceanidesulfovibrio marinus]